MHRITIITAIVLFVGFTTDQASASCGHYVVSGPGFVHKDLLTADLPDSQPCRGPGCHGQPQRGPAPVAPMVSNDRQEQSADPAGSFVYESNRDPPSYEPYDSVLSSDSFYPRVDRPPQNA